MLVLCRIVQLVISVIFQLLFMRDMEKLLGWLRICIIYIICGIAGSLSSAIFIPYHVEVSHYTLTFGLLLWSLKYHIVAGSEPC